MNHKGFVSLPFLILFSISMVLCAYLVHKTVTEMKILDSLKEVNHQIQKERIILEVVNCLIQCESDIHESIIVDDDEVRVDCEDGRCIVDTSFRQIMIYYDSAKVISHVYVQ